MNPNTTTTGVLADEIDLLVDGELGEDQRRELLARLDSEAGGWKQCAKGFLEAQMWRGAMDGELRVVEVSAKARRWLAPVSALAAALVGFAVAWFGRPEESAVAGVPGERAPEVQRLVEYVPIPVERGGGLVPVSDERGQVYYTTRGEVPVVFLQAMEQAGHKVEHIKRMVNLPQDEGEPLELPVTETRILINHQL